MYVVQVILYAHTGIHSTTTVPVKVDTSPRVFRISQNYFSGSYHSTEGNFANYLPFSRMGISESLEAIVQSGPARSVKNTVDTIGDVALNLGKSTGKALWTVTTAALIVVLPTMLLVEKENMAILMEKQQQGMMTR